MAGDLTIEFMRPEALLAGENIGDGVVDAPLVVLFDPKEALSYKTLS